MPDRPRLVLASASPARLATLRGAGLDPEVVVSGVDESQVSGAPGEVALALAALKARAVAATLTGEAYVVGCDSLLEFDGEGFGKPRDAAEARARWTAMRGRSGVLHTGHCLLELPGGREVLRAARTTVHFASPDDVELEAYLSSGEPLAVAGAFTLDGLGGAFVEGIEGDPHNVVGISLPLLRGMFAELGVSWVRLWALSG